MRLSSDTCATVPGVPLRAQGNCLSGNPTLRRMGNGPASGPAPLSLPCPPPQRPGPHQLRPQFPLQSPWRSPPDVCHRLPRGEDEISLVTFTQGTTPVFSSPSATRTQPLPAVLWRTPATASMAATNSIQPLNRREDSPSIVSDPVIGPRQDRSRAPAGRRTCDPRGAGSRLWLVFAPGDHPRFSRCQSPDAAAA
jgi:hypothetical protein